MRDLFAIDDPRADLSYVNTRAPRHHGAERARGNCDDLWRDFEPYASAHFLAEFPYQFHQRWFEMYVAVTLLRAGLRISCPDRGAPDVRVHHPDGLALWIEATAPTGGNESNPDRVVEPPWPKPGAGAVARYVPREAVTMRVSGAVHTKAAKLRGYRERGIIQPEDQAVVAINVSQIPHGSLDAESYALGATYGVGPQYVVVDHDTAKAVDSGFQHRPQLLRRSGSPIDAAPFLATGFDHVTGALISAANAANCPAQLGLDFMMLPNPYAAPAYIAGQIPVGREWRLVREGDVFRVEIIEHQKRAS